jgi:16S rRNA (guanine527-N7)-methyltransferase
VSSNEFRERLLARTAEAGLSAPIEQLEQLETYFRLLALWNAKINLTAYRLLPPSDEALDRLLIEPLVAAQHIPESVNYWVDVGSGGGSPAIPMKIARPDINLTMIESRERKTAFLREATRVLALSDVDVVCDRFREAAARMESGTVDLVTVRAVRRDQQLLEVIRRILSPSGRF